MSVENADGITSDVSVRREVVTHFKTRYGDFMLLAYTSVADGETHVVLTRGELSRADPPVLVRIHSECLTGDVFKSLQCDCGPQLERALELLAHSDRGVFIYLRQEGRGIGLLNKLRAYKLQEEGYDTVEANEIMGFPADSRDYKIAASILKDLGVLRINLLTNNPKKVESLIASGISVVERIPLEVPANPSNVFYLQTKKTKLGHLLRC
ncbi:MAG: GTP cyclohydrolase II [Candidatus Sigynarchaeota archaeon]